MDKSGSYMNRQWVLTMKQSRELNANGLHGSDTRAHTSRGKERKRGGRKKDTSKKSLRKLCFPHQLCADETSPFSAIKSTSSHSPSPKIPRFASRQQHCVSLFTAKYSAATAAPLQTELRTARSAELRASAREEKKKKKKKKKRRGWWYPAYIFVVICVFQVKLQIRGHFHHREPQRGGMRGKQGQFLWAVFLISYQC